VDGASDAIAPSLPAQPHVLSAPNNAFFTFEVQAPNKQVNCVISSDNFAGTVLYHTRHISSGPRGLAPMNGQAWNTASRIVVTPLQANCSPSVRTGQCTSALVRVRKCSSCSDFPKQIALARTFAAFWSYAARRQIPLTQQLHEVSLLSRGHICSSTDSCCLKPTESGRPRCVWRPALDGRKLCLALPLTKRGW